MRRKTCRGEGTKVIVLADGQRLPLAIHIESANRAEVQFIEPLLFLAITAHVPGKLTYYRTA